MSDAAHVNDRAPTRPHLPILLAAGVAVLAAVVAAVWLVGDDRGSADGDQGEMAARAGDVMPFDLEATTHTFVKTDSGGVQEVVADDAGDSRNLELVRDHLESEARAFERGDYRDPARIHGMEMPGVAELADGARRVDVRYEAIRRGGRITYSTDDPVLVSALHAWFDRQSSDHATPGMGG